LATTDGALWVRLDGGQVVRLDPVTGAIQKHIEPPPGDGLCQGFGSASDDAVYSCAYAGVIERIDPSTNKVVNQLKSNFSTDQGHLVLAADKVWVLTPDGDKITPIDPGDDSLGKSIDLGSYCVELSGGGPVIYATCTSDGLVLRVDVARREVTHRLALTDPRAIWASSSGVFVSFEGGVAQLDPESLEPTAVYDVTLDLRGGIYADSERAWLRADKGPFLTVIDPAAHKIVQTITAPDLPSGGSALRVGDVVWATASDDGILVGLETK
jgi:streptogramin lyase